jgi:hypothetical protein
MISRLLLPSWVRLERRIAAGADLGAFEPGRPCTAHCFGLPFATLYPGTPHGAKALRPAEELLVTSGSKRTETGVFGSRTGAKAGTSGVLQQADEFCELRRERSKS